MGKENQCKHLEFDASVNTGRITEKEGGEVVYFVAELTVNCRNCNKKLMFRGVPNGYNSDSPTVSLDGFKINLPAGIEGEIASTLDVLELRKLSKGKITEA